MTFTRAQLDEIPAGTEILRTVRHWHAADVADVTDQELDNARRWLLAAAYSCSEGARRVAALLAQRHNQPPMGAPCTSDSPTPKPEHESNHEPTASPAPA